MSNRPTWYFRKGEQERGPVSKETIQHLVSAGELCGDDFVRKGQDGEWRTIKKRDHGTASTPKAPPLPPALPTIPSVVSERRPSKPSPAGRTKQDTKAPSAGAKENDLTPKAPPLPKPDTPSHRSVEPQPSGDPPFNSFRTKAAEIVSNAVSFVRDATTAEESTPDTPGLGTLHHLWGRLCEIIASLVQLSKDFWTRCCGWLLVRLGHAESPEPMSFGSVFRADATKHADEIPRARKFGTMAHWAALLALLALVTASISTLRGNGREGMLDSISDVPPPVRRYARSCRVLELRGLSTREDATNPSTYLVLSGKKLVAIVAKERYSNSMSEVIFGRREETPGWSFWKLARQQEDWGDGTTGLGYTWELAYLSRNKLTLTFASKMQMRKVKSSQKSVVEIRIDEEINEGYWTSTTVEVSEHRGSLGFLPVKEHRWDGKGGAFSVGKESE